MPFDIGQLLQQYPQLAPPQVVPPGQVPQPVNLTALPAPPVQPPPDMASQGQSPAAPASVGAALPPEKPGIKSRIGQLFQDPDFNKSLIAFGASLMQSPQAGHNLGDVFGQSLMTGMQTYQGLKDQRTARADKQTEQQKRDAQQAKENQQRDQQIQQGSDRLDFDAQDSQRRSREAELDRLSRENIAKIQAASAGRNGGGASAIEYAHQEAIKSYIHQGLSPEEAQSRATKDVILSQKSPSEDSMAQRIYLETLKNATTQVLGNINNLGQDPAVLAQQIDALAQQLAMNGQRTYQGLRGEQTGVVGNGTQQAPFTEQEAQAKADKDGKAFQAFVRRADGTVQQVNVTPTNAQIQRK